MLPSISWALPALDDLLEVLDFFEDKQEPEVGKELVARIYKSAEILNTFPRAGRKGLVPGTRELLIPDLPYFLVYRTPRKNLDKNLVVLRVMHTSRLWSGDVE